jgi:hypothetical protein
MLRRLFSICVVLVAADGCQRGLTTVAGTVTLDKRPLCVDSDARGTVVFQPRSGQGAIATGLLDPTGHFQLATGASIEILPGKYNVSVSVVQLLPKSEQAEQGAESITPAKYASTRESGLQADVLPGENQLNFDLTSSADDSNADLPGSNGTQPGNNSSNSN